MVDVDVKGMNFRGKAAVFDAPWDPALTEKYGYEEIVRPGAFAKAIRETRSVPLLREHDPHMLLATTHAGTMTLTEEPDALIVEAQLPPTPLGEETRSMVERGDLRGMSYGVQSDKSGSRMVRVGGVLQRAIHEFRRMLDVSITWDPAYAGTTTELRSFAAVAVHELGDVEDEVRRPAADYRRRTRELVISSLERGW